MICIDIDDSCDETEQEEEKEKGESVTDREEEMEICTVSSSFSTRAEPEQIFVDLATDDDDNGTEDASSDREAGQCVVSSSVPTEDPSDMVSLETEAAKPLWLRRRSKPEEEEEEDVDVLEPFASEPAVIEPPVIEPDTESDADTDCEGSGEEAQQSLSVGSAESDSDVDTLVTWDRCDDRSSDQLLNGPNTPSSTAPVLAKSEDPLPPSPPTCSSDPNLNPSLSPRHHPDPDSDLLNPSLSPCHRPNPHPNLSLSPRHRSNPGPNPNLCPGPNSNPSPRHCPNPGPNPNTSPHDRPNPSPNPNLCPGPNPSPRHCPNPGPNPNSGPRHRPNPSPCPGPKPNPGPRPNPNPGPCPSPSTDPAARPYACYEPGCRARFAQLLSLRSHEAVHRALAARAHSRAPCPRCGAGLRRFRCAGGALRWACEFQPECSAMVRDPLMECAPAQECDRGSRAPLLVQTVKQMPARPDSRPYRHSCPRCGKGYHTLGRLDIHLRRLCGRLKALPGALKNNSTSPTSAGNRQNPLSAPRVESTPDKKSQPASPKTEKRPELVCHEETAPSAPTSPPRQSAPSDQTAPSKPPYIENCVESLGHGGSAPAKVKNASTRDSQQLIEPPRPFVCSQCDAMFSDAGARRRHEQLHRPWPVACPRCPETFALESLMQRHLVSQHAPPHRRSPKKDACQSPAAGAGVRRSYRRIPGGGGSVVCPICLTVCASVAGYSSHRRWHERMDAAAVRAGLQPAQPGEF